MVQWTCLLVVIVFTGTLGDECDPPKPGDKTPSPHDCCKKEHTLPTIFKENIPICTAKFPVSPKFDFKESMSSFVCIAECMFDESSLLTPEGKIDLPAFKKLMTSTYPDLKNISENVDKCYEKISSQIDSSSDCKSGAFELENCLFRNCFLNCPKSLWTPSKECEDLRKKVEMCPELSIVQMKKPN